MRFCGTGLAGSWPRPSDYFHSLQSSNTSICPSSSVSGSRRGFWKGLPVVDGISGCLLWRCCPSLQAGGTKRALPWSTTSSRRDFPSSMAGLAFNSQGSMGRALRADCHNSPHVNSTGSGQSRETSLTFGLASPGNPGGVHPYQGLGFLICRITEKGGLERRFSS